jgi:glucose-1-phosphate cytidylyltransferase
MKVLILAGGFGTRLSEETGSRPKPMIEIGGKPLLWHLMKIYSSHGFNEFVVLLGYKGSVIKDYYMRYFYQHTSFTIDLKQNSVEHHGDNSEPWKITLLDTGEDTMTGGRVRRAAPHVAGKPFMLTYGDGLSDVNITDLVKFHQGHGKLISMTTVIPEGRFGRLEIGDGNQVKGFVEKPREENWINGGFFVCQPRVMDYIQDDNTVFERKPLETLAREGQLMAYKHDGFWRCMDTVVDKKVLEDMWVNDPKWKIWK